MDIKRLLENREKIELLLNTIVAGENPITDETYDDWRSNVENIAIDLLNEIYK
jgi:hypothetical protein